MQQNTRPIYWKPFGRQLKKLGTFLQRLTLAQLCLALLALFMISTGFSMNNRLMMLEAQTKQLGQVAQFVYVSECLTNDWFVTQDEQSLRSMFCKQYLNYGKQP